MIIVSGFLYLSNPMAMIADRLLRLEQSIQETALSCNRDPKTIHLVAVSKRKPLSDVRSAAQAGQLIFGENRVQEAVKKQQKCQDISVNWHMIGHLQKNKVKQAASVFDAVHSIDSIKLAELLSQALTKLSRTIECFIQVKLTEEESKTGVAPENLSRVASYVQSLPNLKLVGLMGMPPFTPDPEQVIPYFRKLRLLRDDLNSTTLVDSPIQELSMGMSHDFKVAIREGATYIRIGTLIFGERTDDRR